MSSPIRIEKLQKSFGNVEVLKSIDIDIAPGEFFTLLGASGCGKTTLLRCVAGFEVPTAGRILFDGSDITTLKPWQRNIGFVFQNYALWPHVNVFENISYGLKMRKVPRHEMEQKVAQVLETVNLPGIEKRFPGRLSGGQQQRVAIARALVFNPEVLLLDEPLSNLDAKLRERMRTDIRELQKRLGITSIYVTHDQEEALEISDRIAVMEDGRIRQIGSPIEVYDMPADHFTAGFVGKSNFVEGAIKAGRFTTQSGIEIPLPQVPPQEGEAVLCFRPENVREGSGSLQAEVTSSTYLGNTFQLAARLADGTSFLLESRKRVESGARISVEIERCQFFPGRPR